MLSRSIAERVLRTSQASSGVGENQWSHSCFDAFWVVVSFGEARGQQGQHVRTANVDVCKAEETYMCWELLSLCKTAKLETTGWSPSQMPIPIKGGKAEVRKKLHTDLIPPHQSTRPAAMKGALGRSRGRSQGAGFPVVRKHM